MTLRRWNVGVSYQAIYSKCRIRWPLLPTVRLVPPELAPARVQVEVPARAEEARAPMTRLSMPSTHRNNEAEFDRIGAIGTIPAKWLLQRKTTTKSSALSETLLKMRSSGPIANWRVSFIPT